MKYYELTPEEANKIGYHKVSKQHHIDARAGRLTNGNFALSKAALYGLKKLKLVDFDKKVTKEITNFIKADDI